MFSSSSFCLKDTDAETEAEAEAEAEREAEAEDGETVAAADILTDRERTLSAISSRYDLLPQTN